jgi:Na+/melibiose symporter-like transporter
MPENSKQSRVEVILAAMAVSVIGLSVLSILTTLLLVFLGVTDLPAQLPLIGLPVGFLIIIALLVAAIIRRSREARDN